MGNLFSRYYYSYSTNELPEQTDADDDQPIETRPPPPEYNDETCRDPGTPQKSIINNRPKVFAAYVPDSPERYSFQDFGQLKSFLNSPIGKKKGTRFKKCDDEKDLENFYSEQLSVSTCNEASDISSSSIEPDLPYKEIPAKVLTEFRIAIEKHEHNKFDELLRENPRFLVNTSNDLPTILHIGTRYNALHIATRTSNPLAVKKILCLISDKAWLTNAYATDRCMEERSNNLLDAMLNTPDKIENNTPLHYACKFGNVEIVETLLNFKICNRESVNNHNERPIDVVGLAAKGNKHEIKEIKNKIMCAFHKEAAI